MKCGNCGKPNARWMCPDCEARYCDDCGGFLAIYEYCAPELVEIQPKKKKKAKKK